MIIMCLPDKSFPRAGKGTVQKTLCVDLYQKEIDDVYDRQNGAGDHGTSHFAGTGFDQTLDYLKKWIAANTGLTTLSDDQDIFEAGIGMDSLFVVKLSRELGNAQGDVEILPKHIYSNPTPSKLATFIAGKAASSNTNLPTREEQMDALLEEASSYLQLNARLPIRTADQPLTVAVTGTTGSLGSHLLRSLLSCRPQVGKVYCLNRKSEAEILGSGKFSRDGLQDGRFVQIKVSEPRLGLSRELYLELAHDIDIFIHNAWDVNFNKSLDSFQSQVHGVRQIINLCASSTKGASLHMMSTIGTVGNWKPDTSSNLACDHTAADNHQTNSEQLGSETLHRNWTVSMGMGYAESKHISEHLVARACEESDLSASIYRIGQIAGSINPSGEDEVWNRHEWIPTIIQTSLTLGVLPSDLGSMTKVDWIPVNVLSDVLVELALVQDLEKRSATHTVSDQMPQVFHVINPRDTNWSTLLPTISGAAMGNPPLRQVPLHEWVDIVKEAGTERNANMAGLPALKMTAYFESLTHHPVSEGIRLDTQKICASSHTLSKLQAVKPEWMALWMRQWQFDAKK